MESNGKSIDRNGDLVNYQTGTIVWGSTGTNMQHAFMQLVHQGTKLIPSDFIGYKNIAVWAFQIIIKNSWPITMLKWMRWLLVNLKKEVLQEMNFSNEANKMNTLAPYKVFEGNRPSNAILFEKLTPESLGELIAMYET